MLLQRCASLLNPFEHFDTPGASTYPDRYFYRFAICCFLPAHSHPCNAQYSPQQTSYATAAANAYVVSRPNPSYAEIAQQVVANKPTADIWDGFE